MDRILAQETLRSREAADAGPDELGRLVERATGDKRRAAAAAKRRAVEIAEAKLATQPGPR